jgi:hypothetical protein
MIVGGDGQGHEDGGTAHGGQLGNGAGARTADKQMGIGQTAGHILEIGRQLGGDVMRA